MEETMDIENKVDDEETERKLLADTSDEEVDDKIDDENKVLESDMENEGVESNDENNSGTNESDDDNDEDDDADEVEVRKLEATLVDNPYEYETHKLLIEKLQTMGELDRLRASRENMSSIYPLTPAIWLSWLRDEMKLAVSTEHKIAVMELCERAVKDYLSVEVWLEYLQFSTGLGTDAETIEKIRTLFERALTAAGLHVIKGTLIWDTFREFEIFLASMSDSTDVNQNKEQVNRIGKLYRRQLSCPLLDMEKTFEEYELWRRGEGCDCTEDVQTIKSGYERALIQLKARLPFEEKVLSAQNKSEQLDAYKAYLMNEKQIGDPGRMTILYERAIADLSLENSLWIDYIDYVETNIRINDITEGIYNRVVRNITWCVKVWIKWIRFCEKIDKPMVDIHKLVEHALAAGFSSTDECRNLWMTYLEYLRRKIDEKVDGDDKYIEILRDTFNRACEHLATFGLEGDPSCEVLQFWARTEAIHLNDMEKARTLWADIMSQGHSGAAASWLEYISLERCYGDTKHLRKLFHKALASVKDWPESIATAWINFERDEGTLEQMELCEIKTTEKLKQVAQERQKLQVYSSPPEGSSQSKKACKRKQTDDSGRWKNLGVTLSKNAKVEKSSKPTKRETSLNSINKNKSEDKNVSATTQSKIAPPPGYRAPSEEKLEQDTSDMHEVDEKITVFVSNLDYTATEDEIREALKPSGEITLFRMVKDYKGRSKGFCYVQLTRPEDVEEALKLDRTRINGRPMFVSRCDPNKTSRGTAFKYKTTLEKNKLFVKGLPLTTTKEDLENIFKVHGALKDVRLVLYRNGHSKGLAYVDFEDGNAAAKALIATDGMTIIDKEISVAISQPPERKKQVEMEDFTQSKSLGGSTASRSSFGNPKTILSMVPRTVKRDVVTTNGNSVSENGVSKPMSNQDFRSMLLNKK